MIKRVRIANNEYNDILYLELKPIKCPYCHQEQMPDVYSAIDFNGNEHICFCKCTNSDCGVAFNVVYDLRTSKFTDVNQGRKIKKEFSDIISGLSESFCSI